jgi:ParB/RepB/Spo0J family partition protein
METKYTVQSIPMDQILSDPNFNCRGHIAPIDVIDLAKDIEKRGLDQPIVLQPYDKQPPFLYRIVAGHRRHMAFRINNSTHIPAYVRPDLSEVDARMLNLRENLHRQELNIKQEAKALEFFLNFKNESGKLLFTEKELADIFGQSRGWVQVRKILLDLPESIQNEAAAGMLSQDQIRKVSNCKTDDDKFALVRKIKETRLKGDKVRLTPSIQRPTDILKAKERKKAEIEEMSGLVYDLIGPGLVTRFAAWSAGNISTLQFFNSLQEYCKENNIPYKTPKFIGDGIMGIKS